MKRIILSGANGTMGRVIAASVKKRGDCTIAAGVDPAAELYDSFPVYRTYEQCQVEADVIIDFSHPAALTPLLQYAKGRKLPVVVATTGISSEQVREIETASKTLPVFFTANMSLGVNLLAELCRRAARVLGGSYDIEIIEKHHNQKIDAPSGTALMLAEVISSALPEQPKYIYDRHSRRQKRGRNEIGIHAVRGGSIVGEHDVIFAGQGEVLQISHSAASKEVFATGSVNAALFLCGQSPGLYDMSHLV